MWYNKFGAGNPAWIEIRVLETEKEASAFS